MSTSESRNPCSRFVPPDARRPTFAEIDLGKIAENVRTIKSYIGKNVKLMIVVKADAYGHGAGEVANVALRNGADYLGVALVEEGCQLRELGIKAPILVFDAIFPEQAPAVVESDLEQVVCDLPSALHISRAATHLGKVARVHLKVDTGMSRIGVHYSGASKLAKEISRMEGVEIRGVMTHFADAEDPNSNFARVQLERFRSVLSEISDLGIDVPLKHIANSGGTLNFPESYFNLVRVGIIAYGMLPSQTAGHRPAQTPLKVEPALSLKTKVVFLKEVEPGTNISYGRTFIAPKRMRIATLPIGYADGYSRLLSNRAEVLIRGRRARVVGNITMDMTMVDVTDIPNVGVGDEAILMGSQGGDCITADEIASLMGTINYEVVCNIGKRVPRKYIKI
ncbi:MAG: alanine racemase [bacterium]